MSDVFGTNHQAWHLAKRVKAAIRFWEAHNCKTSPKKQRWSGRPLPPKAAVDSREDLYQKGFFQKQRTRLQTEIDLERVQYAKIKAARGKPTSGETPKSGSSPGIPAAPRSKAAVVIATVETRFCLGAANLERSMNNYATMMKVRNYGAAINLHYAQKHGYEYIVFCEGDTHNVSSAWLKVAAMEWLVRRASVQETPTYILMLDSDAYVRAIDTRLEDWLVTNNVKFPSLSWSLMLARESKAGPFDPSAMLAKHRNKLNTGVAYAYVDPAQQDRTGRFLVVLQLWQRSTCDSALCLRYSWVHPWEQGCLEKLLFTANESLRATQQQVESVVHVSQQHMNLWNGPWGVFVRHVWGGPGKEKRLYDFDDMVDSYRIDVPASLAAIKAGMVAPPISMSRPCT